MVTKQQLEDCGINPLRVAVINPFDATTHGSCVLYWMQASIRSGCNASLEYAVMAANNLRLPLSVCFVLTPDYPSAQHRHYHFLGEGLSDVSAGLKKRNINFIIKLGCPADEILKLSSTAALLVCDCGYTRIQRQWRKKVYINVRCPAVEVEDNVVVPIETASDKEEYAARTIRPKINSKLDGLLKPFKEVEYDKSLNNKDLHAISNQSISKLTADLGAGEAPASKIFKGGLSAARKTLDTFISKKLTFYDKRNNPCADVCSCLSPYLHFGMISPVEIALAASGKKGSEDFLEQLIVRRELAVNFVYYNQDYDKYQSAVPNWARATLQKAVKDPREYIYNLERLENAQTHDPAWNAAQRQMVANGYMAGYMRMYWGKKVIEWTKTPEQAFETLIYLNDKYQLDGRDPNGYCGVAWCFGKHDRPWTKRPIFGTIRYMNYAGLKRKFDVDAYIKTL